jgi:hypothetical protein
VVRREKTVLLKQRSLHWLGLDVTKSSKNKRTSVDATQRPLRVVRTILQALIDEKGLRLGLGLRIEDFRAQLLLDDKSLMFATTIALDTVLTVVLKMQGGT